MDQNESIKKSTKNQKKKKSDSSKSKKQRDDVKSFDRVVTKKRMASLNAKAILAASYENENYAAKHEETDQTSSSDTEQSEDDEVEQQKNKEEPPTTKKQKKDVKMELEEVSTLICNNFLWNDILKVYFLSFLIFFVCLSCMKLNH